jgi:class 3 adenylate cyclase
VKPLGLEVRAGLHTGEVEVMGDNIGGIAVHIAARISAEAHASEVVASSTTKDLVVGSGFTFEPNGNKQLKGIPGEWALFAVTA